LQTIYKSHIVQSFLEAFDSLALKDISLVSDEAQFS